MVYSPPPAPWLRSLQRPDKEVLSDEAKDTRAYFLDTDLGALEHRQSALEQETSALTHRVHGLDQSKGLRLPPPRRSEKRSPETIDVEGEVAIPIWRLRARAIMTKGHFRTILPDLASSHPPARSRVPHATSIKFYVKDRDSSASSSGIDIDSGIERGGARMLNRHSESSVNPYVRLNPLASSALRRNGSFPQINTERPPSAEETARQRDERKHGLSTEPVPVSAYVGSSKNLKDLKDVSWGSRDPTDSSERFRRRRPPKAATPDSDDAPRACSKNLLGAFTRRSDADRRVSIRVPRDIKRGRDRVPEPFGGQSLAWIRPRCATPKVLPRCATPHASKVVPRDATPLPREMPNYVKMQKSAARDGRVCRFE